MPTYGNTGSATFSQTFDTSPLDQMMAALPDNTQNLITARDARDSVYTLWNRLDGLSASVTSIGTASGGGGSYTNLTPTTIAVGGIPAGSTFSNQTLQNMFDLLLYPYTAPSAGLSVNSSPREYGSSTVAILNWSANKGKNTITSISISTPLGGTISIVPTGNSQTGVESSNAISGATSSFVLSVSDGTSNVTSTAVVYWANRVYWGTLPIGHPLVTSGSATFSALDLSISGVVSSSSLANPETYVQTRLISASNSYVFFMWPTRISSGFNINTDMKVGGFTNNNFTKTRNGIIFYNAFGYTEAYDVWVYNNVLFSTLTYDISV